jgi:hypothetical protein
MALVKDIEALVVLGIWFPYRMTLHVAGSLRSIPVLCIPSSVHSQLESRLLQTEHKPSNLEGLF